MILSHSDVQLMKPHQYFIHEKFMLPHFYHNTYFFNLDCWIHKKAILCLIPCGSPVWLLCLQWTVTNRANPWILAGVSIHIFLSTALWEHSHKILTIQQGKPCHIGFWCNPCSDPEKYQAGRASQSCSDTKSGLGEMIQIVRLHCV